MICICIGNRFLEGAYIVQKKTKDENRMEKGMHVEYMFTLACYLCFQFHSKP